MTLQDIQKALQSLAAQNGLTFATLAKQVREIPVIMESLPPVAMVKLANPQMSLEGAGDKEKLTIRDKISWGLLEGISTMIVLTPDTAASDHYLARLTFQAADTLTLSIPGIDWFTIDRFSISGYNLPFHTSTLVPQVLIEIGATLMIKGDSSQTSLPIKIEADPTGSLLVSLNTSSIQFPSINNILAAFGNADGILLPDTINQIAQLSLRQLQVGFDPETPTVTFIGVEIGNSTQATHDWPIIPGVLSLHSYTIGLTITDPLHTRDISGLIAAQMKLGSVDMAVAALRPAAGGWQFQGEIGQENPVPLGDLLRGIGQQFGVPLPDILHRFTLKDFVIEFDSATGKTDCSLTLDFTIAGRHFELSAVLSLVKGEGGEYLPPTVSGKLLVNTSIFTILFENTVGLSTFTGVWQQDGPALGFGDLAAGFGFTLPGDLPPDLDLELVDAAFVYDFTQGGMVLTAASKNYGTATFSGLINQKTSQEEYLFSLDIGDIDLTGLPLVGSKLPKDMTLGLRQLQVLVASMSLGTDDVKTLNLLFADLKKSLVHSPATLPASGVPVGATLSMLVSRGDLTSMQPLSFTLGGGAGVQVLAQSGDNVLVPTASTVGDSTKWFTIEKAFGPVTFRRIGVNYQKSILSGSLDASLSFGGVLLSLDGLSFDSPLSSFKPSFHLDGLGLAVDESPLNISGGFLSVPGNPLEKVDFQYDGTVILKAETFTLSGLGSYAQVSGQPSLFIFATIEGSFGGPPAFFITGFSGGFGYNRKLRIPAQNEVYQFPFVAGLSDPSALGGPKATPLDVLAILDGRGTDKNGNPLPAWLTVQAGEEWLAAGISFTSFELVKSHALLVAEFGRGELELALIGISLLQLPQEATDPSELLAYVELQFEAVLKPSAGFLGISAVLSPNSFVLDRNCHLTGGFAFFIWYGGPFAGDFVVTLGGYHPTFQIPGNYPQVPRLGFNWQVSDNLTINGEAYFALTPSCVMAGGNLEILFHDGNLRAWCTAYADFLMHWRPLWYTASVGIDIGVSYKFSFLGISKTLSVDLSATANLWGPPTGGEIHIDWYIISFTIGFGPSQPENPQALVWEQFRALLPDKGDVCKITANGGLQTTAQDQKTWFVRSAGFQFTTGSAIPAQRVIVHANGKDTLIDQRSPINIRPMQIWAAASSHTVVVKRTDDNSGDIDLRSQGWTVSTHTRSMPAALWGGAIAGDVPPPSAERVSDQLVGFVISAPEPVAGTTRGIIHWSSETVATAPLPIEPGVLPAPAPAHTDPGSLRIIQQALTDPTVAATRTAIFAVLQTLGYDPGTNDPLNALAQALPGLYTEAPLVA